jgi:two-component system, OmpR family, sensor histidine kinase QseC
VLKRPASLQGRLLLLVLATSLAVWLATAVLTWRDARHELDELLDGHLSQAAALLVAQQASEHDDDERIDAPALHRYAPRVVFQVFHEGRLAMRSANAPAAPMVTGGRKLQGFHTIVVDGERWRVFATRGAENDVQVFVGEHEGSRRSILWAVLRSTMWPVLFALPLLALAGWWAVRQGVRPLRALGGTLAARQAGDLQPVRVPGAPSEMQPMLDALNSLFARIGGLLEGERRFTGDAAHELRTPIAAIRAQAQVALGAEGEAQRRHALEATLAGCDRATRLVEQLLTLSRLEAEGAVPHEDADLGLVVHRVVAELAPASLQKRQRLELHAAPGCTVRGDETLLAVLARNLVDNAIRYSPPGARIDVGVERSGADIVLSVEDGGPGLSPDSLARLGQRFFRVTGNDAAGSGLGWSIMQRIAAAHGATLRALASDRLGGLHAIAAFPATPQAAARAGAGTHSEPCQPDTAALHGSR